jgi:hypothetical protein
MNAFSKVPKKDKAEGKKIPQPCHYQLNNEKIQEFI